MPEDASRASVIGSKHQGRFNNLIMEMGDNSSEEHIIDPDNDGLAYNKWRRNEVSGGASSDRRSEGSAEADGITVTTRVEVTTARGTPRDIV